MTRKTGPSEINRAPGAVAAIGQAYRDLTEQRQIDIQTLLYQNREIKRLTAELWAQEWFTLAPKYRTKDRLIDLFRMALNQTPTHEKTDSDIAEPLA